MKVIGITFLIASLLGAPLLTADEAKRPVEISVGMDYDTAAKALREAGASEARFFDAVNLDPPPKWNDFALPDHRTITLHAKPSEIFPNVFRVTAIFVVQPNKADLGGPELKEDRKTERVERFIVPNKPAPKTPK